MNTIEQHKESFKSKQRIEKEAKKLAAFKAIEKIIGDVGKFNVEHMGPSNIGGEAVIKFKNHLPITIYERLPGRYEFIVGQAIDTKYSSFGEVLIHAEIPNTFWNRWTGKYKA